MLQMRCPNCLTIHRGRVEFNTISSDALHLLTYYLGTYFMAYSVTNQCKVAPQPDLGDLDLHLNAPATCRGGGAPPCQYGTHSTV